MDGNLLNKKLIKLYKTGFYTFFNDILADLLVGSNIIYIILNFNNNNFCRFA